MQARFVGFVGPPQGTRGHTHSSSHIAAIFPSPPKCNQSTDRPEAVKIRFSLCISRHKRERSAVRNAAHVLPANHVEVSVDTPAVRRRGKKKFATDTRSGDGKGQDGRGWSGSGHGVRITAVTACRNNPRRRAKSNALNTIPLGVDRAFASLEPGANQVYSCKYFSHKTFIILAAGFQKVLLRNGGWRRTPPEFRSRGFKPSSTQITQHLLGAPRVFDDPVVDPVFGGVVAHAQDRVVHLGHARHQATRMPQQQSVVSNSTHGTNTQQCSLPMGNEMPSVVRETCPFKEEIRPP